jgi:hypothetical protein
MQYCYLSHPRKTYPPAKAGPGECSGRIYGPDLEIRAS